MSLLVDITTNALEPGYATAARRRAAVGPDSPRRRRAGTAATLAALVAAALLLTVAAAEHERSAPSATGARDRLVADVQRRTASTDQLQQEADRLRQSTAGLRDRALRATTSGAAALDTVQALEEAVGEVAMQGPGLEVRLSDAPPQAGSGLGPDNGAGSGTGAGAAPVNRVLDSDVRSVVNALFAAGAEAVAVNDRRLTALTAIRSAGAAVLVDFRPISSPYRIVALGSPDALETSFATSVAARRMRALAQLYGIGFGYGRHASLRVPAATTATLHYARPAGGTP